ncbi:DEAD/DEAH box helicase [Planococcus sp. CAU13]|uniref:DEAD/DEAH box helicase n=1 Tax=Planococcus sp. CAU13 TaxID=1541197 RepID=UPI00052FDC5F|nr:DEAD/DEAH box helicase [Planococcus sp. CAU13]
MKLALNDFRIKKLCGMAAYRKGKAYFDAGKVRLQPVGEHASVIRAEVHGAGLFEVAVMEEMDGGIQASCSCPPVGFVSTYCQHIAATLLAINDLQQQELQKAQKLMALFGDNKMRPSRKQLHFDDRPVLEMSFLLHSVEAEDGQRVFAVRLSAGMDGKVPIRDAGAFLQAVEHGVDYRISSELQYSRDAFSFTPETDAVLHELMKINGRETGRSRVIVAASAWDRLLQLLAEIPSVNIAHKGRVHRGLRFEEELPLVFRFDETVFAGYVLKAEGLDHITVMKPYGIVLSGGALVKLPPDDCRRLEELKVLMEGSAEFEIPAAQVAYFLESVIPGLERIGEVHLAAAVTGRLEESPLEAKLFLDRIRNRLLAGVEFHYGQLIINPSEEREDEIRHYPGVRRQRAKEEKIMEIMNNSLFTQTDGGFYMQDEEAEYDFLMHAIPELEQLLQVYATTAVKMRVQKNYTGPKVKVELKERTDWLAFKLEPGEIPEAEIRLLLAALKEKRKYYRIPNGTLLSLETEEFIALNELMLELGNEEAWFGDEIRLPLIQGLQLVASLEDGDLLDPGAGFAKLLQNLSNPEEVGFEIPAELEGVLRDYQKAGYNWLKALAKYRFGGILADDMGLGKTLQSIAFIQSELPEIRRRKTPALIVAPSSLTYNWLSEFEKFTPDIHAMIIDGNKAKRTKRLADSVEADVIITSYPSLRMDGALYKGKTFHTLFLDEAQAFKNPVTQTAKAVKGIEADHRFALTGTPIENSLDELWSIFHVVFPELLPNRMRFAEMRRTSIAKRVRPFILRRVKQDVLKELPDKVETLQFSELYPAQKKYYAAYLAELKQEALKHLNKDSLQKNRIKILAGLTRLRQLCCHPSLFVDDYQGGSAKFDQLMEIVESSRMAGRRVLVFSQFTGMLQLIGNRLTREGRPYFYLDGQTPPQDRVEMCSRFNEGEGDLFLISLKAGGTGLNLTGADTVILYDLWWNPAVEQQAASRAHRMGQQHTVQVIRMVAKGTIEEKITELQAKKLDLIDEVIQSGQEPLAAMTEDDIRELLMI